MRVVCDRCGGTLKVPGLPSGEAAEEDWLKLDTEPEPVRSVPRASHDRIPSAADIEDEFRLSEPIAPPSPANPREPSAAKPKEGLSPPSLSEADLALLAGFGGEPPVSPSRAKSVPAKSPTNDRFRVRCPVCESVNYAAVDQVGKRIRCGDCDSPITVPPPPQPKQTYQPDIESAPVFKFSDGEGEPLSAGGRPADPFRRSAADYLRAAEQAEDEVEESEWELPSFGSWFTRLGKIFLDPAVSLHVGLLSLLAFIPSYILLKLDQEAPIVMMGMFAVGLVFAALVVACGFAILQAVANGEEKVSEWPVFDPMEWLGQIMVAICAVAVAAGPIALLAHFFSPGGLATVALAMFSLYLLYPIVLMSMLDEQSVFVPFSADVSKSVMRAPDQWGAAYLASAGLFAAMFFAYLFASICSAVVGAVIVIFCTIGGVFVYFGILGQLAYGIGQAINAPPMINDIDRSKRSDDEIASR